MSKPIIREKQALSDELIHNARPKTKQYRLYDGAGLLLLIAPSGGKWWRFKYRFQGREKTISLGTFPNILLTEARVLRDNARQILSQGIDPSAVRKTEKAEWKAEKAKAVARTKADQKQAESVTMPSVRYMMDGVIELWKGSNVMRLSPDEARFVANQLSALMRCSHGVK